MVRRYLAWFVGLTWLAASIGPGAIHAASPLPEQQTAVVVDQALARQNQERLQAEWARFCDRLKAAGETLITHDRGHPIDTAEGFQYLAMLTGMAIERVQFYDSHARPIVARTLDGYKKIGLDSSDNLYRTVSFDPGGVYRVSGTRGSSAYLGFQVNAGTAAVANLNHTEMRFDEDGSFELYLGGRKRGQNWIALPEGADNMYIREIFTDWTAQAPGRMWIERLDRIEPPAPATVTSTGERLGAISAVIDGYIGKWSAYVERQREAGINVLRVPRATTGEGGSADNIYTGGYFSIAEDEALVIESEDGGARLWNVQLGNNWFQSLDYQYRQTSLNSEQARPDPDGKYRIVIAHRDPGVWNWLDTAGHPEGVMFYRWNGASRMPPAPVVRRVKLAELDDVLPGDTPRISAEQRAEALAARYRAVARRFAL